MSVCTLWPAALLLGAAVSAAAAAATCTCPRKKKKKSQAASKDPKSPYEKPPPQEGHELVSKMPAPPPASSERTQEPEGGRATVQQSAEETCVATGGQAQTVLESTGADGLLQEGDTPGADATPADTDLGDNAPPPPPPQPPQPPARGQRSTGPTTGSKKEKSTEASTKRKKRSADKPKKPPAAGAAHVIEMPPGCSRKTPFWKRKVPSDDFRAATAKDDFPTNAVTALSQKVHTERNRDKEDIVVVRTFRQGRATFGCGYKADDGKVHATFPSLHGGPVEMKMFQVLQLRPAELQYAWKPYNRRETDGYAPVQANNIAPAVVKTASGRTLLGEVDLEKECARAACRQTSRAVAKEQLANCVYVLCKRRKGAD